MITNWIEPGYPPVASGSIEKLGVKYLRRFQGELKEKMLSDAFDALKYNGWFYVVMDYEWNAADYVHEVESYGFRYAGEFNHFAVFEENPDYKVQTLLFQKKSPRSAREYVFKQVNISDSWRVLDVGPGNYPLERANAYLESGHRLTQDEYLKMPFLEQKNVIWGNLCDPWLLMPKTEDTAIEKFDFVWCSHVLEHVTDPMMAAENLSGLGRSGIVVCPSYVKEAFFMWEEQDHRWDVLPPSKRGGPLRFVRPNMEWRKALREVDASSALCRVMRTGPPRTHDHRTLADWYRRNEPLLDVIVPWEGKLEVQVIE